MNAIRFFRSSISTNKARPFRSSTVTKRSFAAGGQPQSQSQSARLWEGHNTKPEGWENTVYATYFASTVLITLALGFAPDTTINTWAANEARVRLDLKSQGKIHDGDGGDDAEGEAKQFGKHYNVPEQVYDFESVIIDDPFDEEQEDDEDDEDEEDDDDDDEE
jgi:hypothetical protein|eukprot:scaffold2957_cov232-Chaetoceros_neogracile.AAC.3